MAGDRNELIEKGRQIFKNKAISDEAEVWKESSLKYQAKYQESLLINQEIKILLQNCLSAKESLIKDLSDANELLFQTNKSVDSRKCIVSNKETQTLYHLENGTMQTDDQDSRVLQKRENSSTQTNPSDTTGNASNEVVEVMKSQSHIRDAYERAQSQIKLLGDSNAQLKLDLENEKKISALLEGKAIIRLIL